MCLEDSGCKRKVIFMSIPSNEYNQYLSAIKTANDVGDKDALSRIKMQIIAKYGTDDNDVHYLLNRFRYNV